MYPSNPSCLPKNVTCKRCYKKGNGDQGKSFSKLTSVTHNYNFKTVFLINMWNYRFVCRCTDSQTDCTQIKHKTNLKFTHALYTCHFILRLSLLCPHNTSWLTFSCAHQQASWRVVSYPGSSREEKTLHLLIAHEHINLAPMVCACKGHVRMMTYNKARIAVALSDMHEQNN